MASYKNFDELAAALKRDILDKVRSKEVLGQVGEQAVDLIYKRVKTGKGVTSDTAEFPETEQLAPLSDKYKKQRAKKKLGKFGTPNRSNLTATGEMLESMTYKVGDGKVTIEIPSTSRSDGELNSNIAEYVREKRPFFQLSRGEGLVISKTITSIVDGIIRLFNK